MGLALTDALVELSNPRTRLEFVRDPQKFIADRALSPEEGRALLSGTSSVIWRHANSSDMGNPVQQFNRLRHGEGSFEIYIDPVAEVHIENNALTADHPGSTQTFIDASGRLFRLQGEP